MPEDWVGAYKKVNNEIKWRNGNKVIIHIADAGAHGKKFTLSDKYPEEEKKLIKELDECIKKKIKIFGYVIEEDSRNSFVECKKYYQSKGSAYEIFNFEKPKNLNNYEYEYEYYSDDNSEDESESDDDSDMKKKRKSKKKSSKKKKEKSKCLKNKSEGFNYQSKIDEELRDLVIKSITSTYEINNK